MLLDIFRWFIYFFCYLCRFFIKFFMVNFMFELKVFNDMLINNYYGIIKVEIVINNISVCFFIVFEFNLLKF